MKCTRWSTPILAVTAIAGATALILAGLAFAGHPPLAVVSTWLYGAIGSRVRVALSLQESGPLLLTGLAAAVALRCGVFNIGGEGQYLLGAAAGSALAARWPIPGPAWLVIPLVFAGAAAAGAAWALLALVLERWRGVPVVLATILLNFIAADLVGWLIQGPLHDPTTLAPQSLLVDERLRLPVLIAGSKLHLGVIFAALCALALWLVEARTAVGFAWRVIGIAPEAARWSGMPVAARQWQAMTLSGALAGLAGGMQQAGVVYYLSEDSLASGYGYAGVAVALLGRMHPLGVAGAAVFFGMLDTGARNLEKRQAIPHDLGDLAKGLAVLAAVCAMTMGLHRRLRPVPEEPRTAATNGTSGSGSDGL